MIYSYNYILVSLLLVIIAGVSDYSVPRATSTPRREDPVVTGDSQSSGGEDGELDRKARRLSSSSELTQVSNTDVSSNEDDLDNERPVNHVLDPYKTLTPSDVKVELDQPPPVPSTPPPSLDASGKLRDVDIVM